MASLDRFARTALARACSTLVVVLFFPAASLAAPPAGAKVWVASATEKIRPSEPARSGTTARISAARNEFEAFQIVVTGSARNVKATATALTGPGTISDVRLYAEPLINLTQASAPDGATGKFPDALVPAVDEVAGEARKAFPFEVRRGESRAIWVEVFVPASAAPGRYAGTVTVSSSNGSTVVPVELTVWNFVLPSTSSLRTAFGLPWGALPSGHGFSGSDIGTFAAVRARYGQLALDHRVSLSRHDDGMWNDLGHFDRVYGPLMDGNAPTRLAGARLTAVEFLGSDQDLRRWATHYRERGWFERLFQYTCDEPPHQGCGWDDIAPRASAAKAADREFRTLVTTTIQQADQYGVTGHIDLLVPLVNFMDDKPPSAYAGDQRAQYDPFLEVSALKELWMYQSCMSHGCGGTGTYFTGWPSYMIDASAVRNRAMQWLLFRYGATGELYWDTTYAYGLGDPWTSQWAFSGNGDGTLFYPGAPAKIGGTTHVPVASIRLKMIREGMEDYEYLKLVSDLGDPLFAETEAATLFPAPYSTGDVSAAELLAARERLARRIHELRGVPLP